MISGHVKFFNLVDSQFPLSSRARRQLRLKVNLLGFIKINLKSSLTCNITHIVILLVFCFLLLITFYLDVSFSIREYQKGFVLRRKSG